MKAPAKWEWNLYRAGYQAVAGVDEAGRNYRPVTEVLTRCPP